MHGVASRSLENESRSEEAEYFRSLLLEEFFTQASVERAGFSRWIRARFLNSMKGRDGDPAISTVDDLLALSENQFKNHFGIGQQTFRYVQLRLAEYGFALRHSVHV